MNFTQRTGLHEPKFKHLIIMTTTILITYWKISFLKNSKLRINSLNYTKITRKKEEMETKLQKLHK